MLLRLIIENFWRKLGEKILIGSIFGIFPNTKMAIIRPFLGRECRFFTMIHCINMKKLSAKFYNNLNSSIFEFFGIPKIGHTSETITEMSGNFQKVPE